MLIESVRNRFIFWKGLEFIRDCYCRTKEFLPIYVFIASLSQKHQSKYFHIKSEEIKLKTNWKNSSRNMFFVELNLWKIFELLMKTLFAFKWRWNEIRQTYWQPYTFGDAPEIPNEIFPFSILLWNLILWFYQANYFIVLSGLVWCQMSF